MALPICKTTLRHHRYRRSKCWCRSAGKGHRFAGLLALFVKCIEAVDGAAPSFASTARYLEDEGSNVAMMQNAEYFLPFVLLFLMVVAVLFFCCYQLWQASSPPIEGDRDKVSRRGASKAVVPGKEEEEGQARRTRSNSGTEAMSPSLDDDVAYLEEFGRRMAFDRGGKQLIMINPCRPSPPSPRVQGVAGQDLAEPSAGARQKRKGPMSNLAAGLSWAAEEDQPSGRRGKSDSDLSDLSAITVNPLLLTGKMGAKSSAGAELVNNSSNNSTALEVEGGEESAGLPTIRPSLAQAGMVITSSSRRFSIRQQSSVLDSDTNELIKPAFVSSPWRLPRKSSGAALPPLYAQESPQAHNCSPRDHHAPPRPSDAGSVGSGSSAVGSRAATGRYIKAPARTTADKEGDRNPPGGQEIYGQGGLPETTVRTTGARGTQWGAEVGEER
ncbi:unnamed protein product [Discosporangium mesarthrocarpum]